MQVKEEDPFYHDTSSWTDLIPVSPAIFATVVIVAIGLAKQYLSNRSTPPAATPIFSSTAMPITPTDKSVAIPYWIEKISNIETERAAVDACISTVEGRVNEVRNNNLSFLDKLFASKVFSWTNSKRPQVQEILIRENVLTSTRRLSAHVNNNAASIDSNMYNSLMSAIETKLIEAKCQIFTAFHQIEIDTALTQALEAIRNFRNAELTQKQIVENRLSGDANKASQETTRTKTEALGKVKKLNDLVDTVNTNLNSLTKLNKGSNSTPSASSSSSSSAPTPSTLEISPFSIDLETLPSKLSDTPSEDPLQLASRDFNTSRLLVRNNLRQQVVHLFSGEANSEATKMRKAPPKKLASEVSTYLNDKFPNSPSSVTFSLSRKR